MAVRDSGAHPVRAYWRAMRANWRDTLGHLPALLAVGAVLLYGYLSLGYELFYGALGVSPTDVGLSYAGTLARSAGFAVTTLLLLAFLASAVLIDRMERTAVASMEQAKGAPLRKRGYLPVGWAFIGSTALFLILGLIVPFMGAWVAANAVRDGRPVGPVVLGTTFLPLTVLAIHADPARVEPVGKPGDAPAVERLRGRKLLHLGQSGGTVVLYDADAGQALYVPASSTILHVVNCNAKPLPDQVCRQRPEY